MAAKLITDGLAAESAKDGTGDALLYRSGEPDGLWQAASQALKAGDTKSALADAKANLARDPLSIQGFQALAVTAQNNGQPATSARLMTFASLLSWRSTPVQMWLFQQAIDNDDLGQVLMRGDALLRRETMQPFTNAIFQAVLLSPDGSKLMSDTLADAPPWRLNFLRSLKPATPEAAAADVNFVSTLNMSSAPATEAETAPFLNHLVNTGYGEAAAQLWASMTKQPLDSAPIDDPDGRNLVVESHINYSPFRWQAKLSGDTQIIAGPAANGQPAMLIKAGGEPINPLVYRIISLPAGSHILNYSSFGDSDGRIGFIIRCAMNGHLISAGRQRSGTPDWVQISEGFDIPTGNCGTQMLAFYLRSTDSSHESDLAIRGVSIVNGAH